MGNYLTYGRLGILATGILLVCGTQPQPVQAQQPHLRAIFTDNPDGVLAVAFSADGKTLASSSFATSTHEDVIQLWDVATGNKIATFKAPGWGNWCSLAFSPDGKKLAEGGALNRIRLWDLTSGVAIVLHDALDEYGRPFLAFSADGVTLASGGRCITDIELFDVASVRNTRTLKGHGPYGIDTLRFAPDGKTLASAGFRDGVKFWELSDNKAPIVYLAETTETSQFSTAISPDLNLAAGVNDEGDVEVWEIVSGKRRNINLKLTDGDIESHLEFSPDSMRVASWGGGNEIKLWDVATGKEIVILEGHTGGVIWVAFSPDGKTLASCGADKTIKLWDLPTGP